MRVIFTCGGTAGHVNPALALAGYWQERLPDTELLFVGAKRGLEQELIAKAGYPFEAVNVSSFHRSLQPRELRHNLISVKNLLCCPAEARRILREFRPDLVVGTGGYACYPMVKYAAKAGIPTALHESNAVPGLTTKLLEPYARRIMVGFEDCRKEYRYPDRVVVTGTPVRGEFFARTKAQAREKLGLTDDRPLIVSFWGSLGARVMNEYMEEFFRLEAVHEPFHHIHAAGKNGFAAMQSHLRDLAWAEHPRLQLREYIHDMPTVMRAADLVLCRAGASTLSELTALGVPAILVPFPQATHNHQEKNARILEAHGGACVLLQEECSGKKLLERAALLLRDAQRQREMSQAMLTLGIADATDRIFDTVMALTRNG